MLRKQFFDNQLCVIVDNEVICVENHEHEKMEKKIFEKKLNREAKQMEKNKHHTIDQVFYFSNNECVEVQQP